MKEESSYEFDEEKNEFVHEKGASSVVISAFEDGPIVVKTNCKTTMESHSLKRMADGSGSFELLTAGSSKTVGIQISMDMKTVYRGGMNSLGFPNGYGTLCDEMGR